MTHRGSENGFTLVETLLAVFALALLMAAGGALLSTTLSSSRLIDERLDRLNKLELMTAHMRADMGEAIPRLARSVRVGEGRKSFYGGEPDIDNIVLGLVRAGWINIEDEADRSELLAIEYQFDNGALIRRAFSAPDRTRQTPAHETVLIEGLRDFEIRFSADGLAADRWALALVGGIPVLPDAVTVDLFFESGGSLSQSFLVGGRS